MTIFETYFHEIGEIGDRVFSAEPLIGTILLFWNNLTAALVMIVFGVILGLPTIFALIINGGALGVLAPLISYQGENPLIFYLLGIVPHGIFEVPAILIAGAIGLKIGFQLLFPPSSSPRLSNLKSNFNLVVNLLPGLVILLAIAAIIEIYLTPQLLNMVVNL